MSITTPKNTDVRLLACLVDEDDIEDSHYRFLVNKQRIKYVTTAPGTFRDGEENRTFDPILLSELLPPFPVGDWNKGHVAKDPKTGETTFVKTERVHLAGIENIWHPVTLNELDFTRQDRLKQRVHVSTHLELNNGEPLLLKIAIWPWEIPSIEVEMTAYQRIDNQGIGPTFLGHLSKGKDGHVIGFVVEWVQRARSAGTEDVVSCKKALGRQHELGIRSGDIEKDNFLVQDGHDVFLVYFETAKHNCSAQELEVEMEALESNLQDTSFRGGIEAVYE